MRFRDLIRDRMTDQRLSQTQVCNAARVSQCKLSLYLAGRKELNTDTLERVLRVLGWEGVGWGLCRLPPRWRE